MLAMVGDGLVIDFLGWWVDGLVADVACKAVTSIHKSMCKQLSVQGILDGCLPCGGADGVCDPYLPVLPVIEYH